MLAKVHNNPNVTTFQHRVAGVRALHEAATRTHQSACNGLKRWPPAYAQGDVTPTPGHSIDIAPVTAFDVATYRAHLARLSCASLRLRFAHSMSSAALDEAAERAASAHTIAVRADGVLVGIGELHMVNDTDAEAAFSIEDRWQGRGLGRRLFASTLGEAAARSIRHIHLFYAAANTRMHRLVTARNPLVERDGTHLLASIRL